MQWLTALAALEARNLAPEKYTPQERDILTEFMIPIKHDTKGQPLIEWQQSPEGWKRAWIQRKEPEKDWAGTGRYLNIVRIDPARPGSGGNPTDFPIFSDLPDEQILEAFVAAVCAVTGCRIP